MHMYPNASYKVYRSKGYGTTMSVYRGLFRTLWVVLKLKLNGYATKIVKY
jgi:hypothetical protein